MGSSFLRTTENLLDFSSVAGKGAGNITEKRQIYIVLQ